MSDNAKAPDPVKLVDLIDDLVNRAQDWDWLGRGGQRVIDAKAALLAEFSRSYTRGYLAGARKAADLAIAPPPSPQGQKPEGAAISLLSEMEFNFRTEGITDITDETYARIEKALKIYYAAPTPSETLMAPALSQAAQAVVDAASTGSAFSDYSQQHNTTMSLVPTKLLTALEKAIAAPEGEKAPAPVEGHNKCETCQGKGTIYESTSPNSRRIPCPAEGEKAPAPVDEVYSLAGMRAAPTEAPGVTPARRSVGPHFCPSMGAKLPMSKADCKNCAPESPAPPNPPEVREGGKL